MNDHDQDPLVADALRAIPVPDHADGFWAGLDARLDVVDRARATTSPERPPLPWPADATTSPAGPEARTYLGEEGRRRHSGSRRVLALAAAAALVAVAAVGASRLPGDDAPTVADRPATPTTVRPDSAEAEAIAAAQRFVEALGAGDRQSAASILGPLSEAYATATAGSADQMLAEASEGYGAWGSVPDATWRAVAVRPGEVVVVVTGTHPGERVPQVRSDAFPTRRAESAGTWLVEPWAFDPDVGGRIELVSPDPTVEPPTLGADQPVQVAVPASGRAWFGLGYDDLVESPVVGGLAVWRRPYPATGEQLLVVVFQTEWTYTAFARTIVVND